MATVLETVTKQSALETTRPEPECPSERETYQFTAEQALKMAEAGVFEGQGRVELWDGGVLQDDQGRITQYHRHRSRRCASRPDPQGLSNSRGKVVLSRSGLAPRAGRRCLQGGTVGLMWTKTPPPLSGMLLVVEVNCSTPEDYRERLAKYAQAGLPTYWVVDGGSRSVSVFTKPRLDGAARYGESKTFNRGEEIEVILGAETFGTVRVSDFFMPEAAEVRARPRGRGRA